ncbi:reverse transcriptase domain-containing protein (plasmid) [Rossellomorea sp. AcN35-11]|nr:group II intron reverse transcriptase/maturase [Rossellomorea aquimaris]WJV32370.1 reverse transcriptase domain-containing protein [Rossellomorea sp. AcN35-11]
MRDPNVVLGNLAKMSAQKDYKFDRLYRNLYNLEFYSLAYQNIYANEGNMTKGTDGNTIDGMSIEKINVLIDALKNETYQPKPAKRIYIDKKNGGKRPLGIPSFNDKLIQEIIRLVLESIFDGNFSSNSHGFRKNHSCHTALSQIKNTFVGVKWFVEGDIKRCFDDINHHILIKTLRKRIMDEKFLRLIWKFLRAGYLEDWKYNNTYSGTPQGGIISPILANIFLNEFDTFMEKLKDNFDEGKTRKANPAYRTFEGKIYRLKKKMTAQWETADNETKQRLLKELRELKKNRRELSYSDPMDSNYKRLQYVRYADDFIIGVIGNKQEAEEIKNKVADFLSNKLDLQLSKEKTLITHNSKRAKFLGYEITITNDNTPKKDKNGSKNRVFSNKPELYMPGKAWKNKLFELGAAKFDGIKLVSKHRPYLISLDNLEILSTYNAEIRGMYNYYKLARNASNLQSFKHILEYSMYKTFANKYKSSVRKVVRKHKIGNEFGIRYKTKEGDKIRFFYNAGFKRNLVPATSTNVELVPNTNLYQARGSLMDRLVKEVCEYCGTTGVPLEMHHVRKLKDLKGKKKWEAIMIYRKRKTMALCKGCHTDLHAGRLD